MIEECKENSGPTVLVVLDGWGIDPVEEHNGIALANTPNYDELIKQYPQTELDASGEAVGLPAGQIGNSEVGHMTIGAGQVIYQDLVRIGRAIDEGQFEANPAFHQAFGHVMSNNSQLHIIGLLSCGGVHSHEDHFLALIQAAVRAGVKKIILHPFLDGRDCNRTDGVNSLDRLTQLISDLGAGTIATVIGRYYAMDRDNNWDRTKSAAAAILDGKATYRYGHDQTPCEVVDQWYGQKTYDELIEPLVWLNKDGEPYRVERNDAIIFTNFRTDRVKQLSKLIDVAVDERQLCFVTMTDYGQEIRSVIAYRPDAIESTLGSVIAAANLKQARIAETEKFAHATYFLNGGDENRYQEEEDLLIPSNKDVKTHDEKPAMKAGEITDAAIAQLTKSDFIFINYANADMVGHTANASAIIQAVETVDRQLGRLVATVRQAGGRLLIIADHGNAETMVDRQTGEPHTAHTTNRVPCILVDDQRTAVTLRAGGGLVDVAPTVLDLMGLEQPTSMTGKSLIVTG